MDDDRPCFFTVQLSKNEGGALIIKQKYPLARKESSERRRKNSVPIFKEENFTFLTISKPVLSDL